MCKKLIYVVSFVLAMGLVLGSVASAAVPGLVGWWKLDGDYLDYSGLGNNGTAGGNPTFVAGKIGSGAISLDGNDYVVIDGVDDDVTSTNLTLSVWIKTTQTSEGNVFATNDGASGHPLMFGVSSGNPYRYDGGGTNYPPAVNDNQWHMLTYVRSGTTGYIYVDAVQRTTYTSGFSLTSVTRWSIGQEWDNASPSDFYSGAVDDARIYNRALTAEEVQQVFIGLPPGTATSPSPADKATDVPRDATLSWTRGEFAATHDVYFGTIFADVNIASRTNPRNVLASSNQSGNSYDPAGLLQFSQTYYWRVDEVNAPPTSNTIFKGDVWHFTVEPFAYPIAGASITPTASSQYNASTGPQNTINGSGLNASDLHSTDEASSWLSSVTGPQPTWIQYEFNQVYKLYKMLVWNCNQTIEPVVGFGLKNVTIEYSTDGASWTTLGTTYEFARAPGTAGYAPNTTIDLSGVIAKYVKLTANSNWGGILPQYGLSEVCFSYIPVIAREPNPASNSTGTDVETVLSWRAGREAAKHKVYFSDNNQAVIDGTAPVTTVSNASHGPLSLDLGKTYYWRVDEVNEAKTPSTWQGDVWNFTAQEYLVVDGFEDYNDFEPDRIFDTWVDGWNVPTNGSQVGSAAPPFAEKTIVHSGKQSMPLSYDNTAASYSEATANIANLAVGNDWTKYGIKTLSLWFFGDPANAAERMYVKLNGVKVAYDGDAVNVTRAAWQTWNIELSSFSGVNLRNITTLIIGLERSGAVGGKGKVYLDDIRLYPYNRQLITPADPGTAGLIGYWKFDGDARDYSGLNNNGTLGGNPTYVAGKVGTNALELDGSDYVAIDGVVNDITSTNITISIWVKTTQSSEGELIAANDSASAHPLLIGLQAGSPYVNDGGDKQFPPAINNGQWHILTYVRSGSTGYMYVDGLLRGSYASSFSLATVTRWSIGQEWDNANPSDFYTGTVDDARFYNRSLSQEQAAWLAGLTKPFDKPF